MKFESLWLRCGRTLGGLTASTGFMVRQHRRYQLLQFFRWRCLLGPILFSVAFLPALLQAFPQTLSEAGDVSVGRSFKPLDENGDIEKRRSFGTPEDRARKFQSAEMAFPRRMVRAGTNVWKLEKAPTTKPFSPTYLWNGRTNGVEEFCKRTFTSALLILKDEQIVYETYLAGSSPLTRFVSFSMAKSITSTLVGMAIEEGFIKNVDEPLTNYLPALIGGAYDGVTIKDALQMVSGVPFEWNVEPYAKVGEAAVTEQRFRFVEAASMVKRVAPRGAKFLYSNMNTELLGWLLENATKRRISAYLEQRLWQPAGMESDAVWLLDGPDEIGRELAAGLFCATLRDYGRFGLLMMNGGRANGHQLISSQWVQSATKPDRPAIEFGKLFEGYALGYGYNWWLYENGDFQAEGVYGQYIFISPKERIVIVKLSHWPEPEMEEPAKEGDAFFKAAVEAARSMKNN